MSMGGFCKSLALNAAALLGCLVVAGVAGVFDAYSIAYGLSQMKPWPGTYPLDHHKISAKEKSHPPRSRFEHLWSY